MPKGTQTRRWVFVLILSFFMLFHQLDIILLRPITTQLITVLNTRAVWVDPLVTISVVVSMLFGLFWGVIFDQHARTRVLALITFLWGVSSWLMGISPTLATYLISGAAGGIDNLSASGVFSLMGDIFATKNRGKIFGLLFLSQPMAFLLMILLSNVLTNAVQWRFFLLVMGVIAYTFTLLAIFFLNEPKRGAREPSMTDVQLTGTYLFDKQLAKENLGLPSMPLIFLFSFLGTIPWFVLTSWISPLFQMSGQVTSDVVAQRLLPGLIALMIGYPVGGVLGDLYAQKRDTGRVMIALLGTLLPSIFILLAFLINDLFSRYFMMLLILMGFFMSFSLPNLIALIFEIALPEVRSFLMSIVLILQTLGSLAGPYLVTILQGSISLRAAVLSVSIGAWLVSSLLLVGLFFTLPGDIDELRRHMAYRSQLERRLSKSGPETEG